MIGRGQSKWARTFMIWTPGGAWLQQSVGAGKRLSFVGRVPREACEVWCLEHGIQFVMSKGDGAGARVSARRP